MARVGVRLWATHGENRRQSSGRVRFTLCSGCALDLPKKGPAVVLVRGCFDTDVRWTCVSQMFDLTTLAKNRVGHKATLLRKLCCVVARSTKASRPVRLSLLIRVAC